ncbi:GMC family oxidoreductase [Zhongshania sp.]|uniref:GMC family oxidoreductase n=1 Tax=Zhongshania sp. TaxID=1971902 RepID=UPI003565CCDF
MKDQYDYIIVGAGSAGCVVANRLSEDPKRQVLLIESGPSDNNSLIKMPRGVGLILNEGSKYIWDYQAHTTPDRPSERWFKGRAIGGSSSVNGMVYVRGAPLDYNNWQAMGCEGWGWDQIGPKFKALEDHDQGSAEYRGVGGPLKVSTHPGGDPLCEAIIDAAQELGVNRVNDVNDVDAVRDGGIGYQASTTWQGKRFSAASAFLKPVLKRSNLTVLNETDVLKIEFTDKRATSLSIRNKKGIQRVSAKTEIILCAGAIETPKLLQLSGVGPAELLSSHGIEVIVDSPDVGQNLREHRHFDVQYKVVSHSHNYLLSGWRAIRSALQYFLIGKGPMTHAAHELGGFVKSTPDLDHADTQFGLMMLSASGSPATGEVTLNTFPGITFLGYFTRPTSQGEIKIQSADFDVAPYINARHLDTEEDQRKAVAVIRWLRKLAEQPALKDWIVEETVPGPAVQSDEDILAKAIDIGGTCFHICGTARMGIDDKAVVNPRLQVNGVSGLRVVDTSIMPTLVSGNTNAPAMVIGMRAADFILEDNK